LATVLLILATALTCASSKSNALSQIEKDAKPQIVNTSPSHLEQEAPQYVVVEKIPNTNSLEGIPPADQNPEVINEEAPKSVEAPIEEQVNGKKQSSQSRAATVETKQKITSHTGVAIIGCYNDTRNIANKKRLIKKAGYEPYMQKISTSTRIGVRFYYDSERSKQLLMGKFKKKFGAETWELKS
jgi:hypothetical protein